MTSLLSHCRNMHRKFKAIFINSLVIWEKVALHELDIVHRPTQNTGNVAGQGVFLKSCLEANHSIEKSSDNNYYKLLSGCRIYCKTVFSNVIYQQSSLCPIQYGEIEQVVQTAKNLLKKVEDSAKALLGLAYHSKPCTVEEACLSYFSVTRSDPASLVYQHPLLNPTGPALKSGSKRRLIEV